MASFVLLAGCGGSTVRQASEPIDAGTQRGDAGDQSADAGNQVAKDAGTWVTTDSGVGDEHQSTTEGGPDDGGICVSPNSPTITLPDLDTPCYFGATARQLLAQVASPYASQFNPNGAPQGYTWSGSLTPSALTLTLAYSGAPVLCNPPRPPDCDPPGPCSPCGVGTGIVSVPLDVTFTTADGAFDERFDGIATYVPGGHVEWQASLPASQIHGTYPPMFSPSETFMFDGAVGGATWDEGAVSECTSHICGGGGSWGE
ncbi:MAG TPA: hypothetical protein VF765_37590 [Polyangiaceae bacterium]